ncbi:hypothetical protein FQR65_LT12316 [Abscondita terminalis]|nr:hypothetical protein FQR65_LT12316 [Abscondita terminalis]
MSAKFKFGHVLGTPRPVSHNSTVLGVVQPAAMANTRQRTIENGTEIPLRHNDEHWKQLFKRYDTDNDGYISVEELTALIESREYEHDIPSHVVSKIHNWADTNQDGRLSYREFVDMIHHPEMRPIFGHLLSRYIHYVVPNRASGRTVTDGQYEDEYTCCPPPVGMIIISLIEIILFCVDVAKGSTMSYTGPVANALMYDPRRRYEAWRYVTYMFVHIGVLHLVVNLCVQVLLGTPLEMVHRWWRVLIIYFAGVVAGSLGTSISDPVVKLAGASGGVYSLITAHIATIIMNWREMEYPLVQLGIFLIITGCDIGTAIYDRYVLDINEHIGYAAHFFGALAGLLVGINILRNISVTRKERVCWWISIVLYVVLMGTAFIWNAGFPSYFPPSDRRSF